MKTPRSLIAAALLMVGLPAVAHAQQGMSPEERAAQVREELASPRPIEALNSVWIEELTWMEVRDAMAAGKTTAIITTGGIEQNGPYLATGKHNYVLQGACEGIARELGNALCAPIVKFVPEGGIEEPTGHMLYPGTISLTQETFEALLTDIASSLKAHGFEHIILLGDSGGNQRGMANVAEALNQRWTDARAHFIPEFYEYEKAFTYMEEELGISEPTSDGLHDDFVITSMMMVADPTSVRWQQRVDAGKASINGVSIADKEATIEIGKKLLQFRVDHAVKAIHAAMH